MPITERQVHEWTVEEFHQMGELGWFRDRRVELIDGEISEMAPQKDTHFAALNLAAKALERAFGPNHWVRLQGPLHLDQRTEPEPDIAVVFGSVRDYVGTGHPKTALLIVEISDTSLAYDRHEKAGLYARAGIAEYWILNLNDRRLEVHLNPSADDAHPFGFRYTEITTFGASQSASPQGVDQQIPVAEMLP